MWVLHYRPFVSVVNRQSVNSNAESASISWRHHAEIRLIPLDPNQFETYRIRPIYNSLSDADLLLKVNYIEIESCVNHNDIIVNVCKNHMK